MHISEKVYVGLCILFSVFIVTGNLIYQKFVSLPIFPFYTFELSVGAILYPATFLLTDLITEFYGKQRADFCVKLALSMNITIACIMIGMDHLNATEWSKVNNEIFHLMFGAFGIAFAGSVLACYISQWIDIRLYLWIRKLTRDRWLWVRNNLSSAISLFVDTTTVILFLAAFGILPAGKTGLLIFNSYLFKLFFVICSTPLFYLGVWIIRRLMGLGKAENTIAVQTN